MTSDSTLSRIYVNLTKIELDRLQIILDKKLNEPIDWSEVITPSADPDEHRARSIDSARIKSLMRYHEKGGPKKRQTQNKRDEVVMSRTEIRKRGL